MITSTMPQDIAPFPIGSGADNREFLPASAGGDHRGNFTTEVEAYQYVRDVDRLDFAAASEHDAVELDSNTWKKCEFITDSFYEPDKFTAFFAYEWTRSPNDIVKSWQPKLAEFKKLRDRYLLYK